LPGKNASDILSGLVMRSTGYLLLLFGSVACALAPNSSGAPIEWSEDSGFKSRPFQLTVGDRRGNAIFFSTNGEIPTPQSGKKVEGPLTISRTTILRAASYNQGGLQAGMSARTFLFPERVKLQMGENFPTHWGTNNGKAVPADYEMDPEIVTNASYRSQIDAALKSLPVVSLICKSEDLFDPVRGIYSNPEQSGEDWERPVSFEYFEANGALNFQVFCGLRIHGGWNRRPDESPKHALRLIFKKKYGPGKLKQPIFGSEGPGELNGLVLRAGCNNTWLHWSGIERRRGEFIRDQWCRETYREMGWPSARGKFVHLYLNGLYWGLYNLTDRPDEHFAAAYLGGKSEGYDALNGSKVVGGNREAWDQLVALVNSGVSGREQFEKVEQLLEIDAFIDYMILNFYGANADWDRSSNWYAARRRPSGKFHFFVWDAERTLEKVGDQTIDFDDDQSPPRLFHKLKENEEFRRRFSDRVKLHFGKGGVLSPESAANRYRKYADQIRLAVICESARWGDYRRDVHRYKEGPYELYTPELWETEVQRLLTEYFPKRGEVVLEQFKQRGLFNP
jgi:hypothetical protein